MAGYWRVIQFLALCPEDFCVCSGKDGLALPMLRAGCFGVIPANSHRVAKDLHLMLDSYKGDTMTARGTHLKSFGLFKVLFITSDPVPVKAAPEIASSKKGTQYRGCLLNWD